MAGEKLGTFQRTSQYELKMQNVWCSLLRDAFPIKGFYKTEIIFCVTVVKMQRLHIQLELFI